MTAIPRDLGDLYVFLEIVHNRVQIVFLKKDFGHPRSAVFLSTLGRRFGERQVYPHLFVEKADQFVGVDAGNERASRILLEHDLVARRLTIELHYVQSPTRHKRPSAPRSWCPRAGYGSILDAKVS